MPTTRLFYLLIALLTVNPTLYALKETLSRDVDDQASRYNNNPLPQAHVLLPMTREEIDALLLAPRVPGPRATDEEWEAFFRTQQENREDRPPDVGQPNPASSRSSWKTFIGGGSLVGFMLLGTWRMWGRSKTPPSQEKKKESTSTSSHSPAGQGKKP